MSSLDDAAAALQQIETDDADVQTQVTNALAAVQAAQSGGTVVDPVWQAVQDVLTANGWVAPGAPTQETPPADQPATNEVPVQ